MCIFRYGKTHCIHKQEKGLRINFSKQPSPLSAHVSGGFGFHLAFKASQNSAQVSLCVYVCVLVCPRLTLMGLNIQIDICCGSKLCLAVSHYITVLNETRDRKQSFFFRAPHFLSQGTNEQECRNVSVSLVQDRSCCCKSYRFKFERMLFVSSE